MQQPKLQNSAFPARDVFSLLSGWWDSKVSSPLKPPKLPTSGTVFVLQPELSSQQAVGILISLQDILGYRPSKKVILKGGYRNKKEFMNLVSKIQKEFTEKQAVGSSQEAVGGVLNQGEGVKIDATIAV
jgi:hypothetical protein